jgi:hypothetical protein
MMPADLKRLHKELLEFERIDHISDEMRAVVESEVARAGAQAAAEEAAGLTVRPVAQLILKRALTKSPVWRMEQ